MHPESLRRRLATIPTLSSEGKRINGLYRLMISDRLLWQQAYISLASNKGAVTPGVDARNTLDGYSPERVERIIGALADGSYRFSPARRVNIPKPKGGTRPLGIPSGDDKLVQEVARQLLNLIYEPVFSDRSHGFRKGRSCHTALAEIQRTWPGVKWMVDVDVRGFFNNIDHEILVTLLERKIDDKRFINLVKGMLAAGYVEDWRFHRTYSGTPQGGVISPVLANVYLHELDRFVLGLTREFNRGARRAPNVEYRRVTNRIYTRRKQLDRLLSLPGSAEQALALKAEISQMERDRSLLSSSDEFDPDYRRLRYCRYADDCAPRTRKEELSRSRVRRMRCCMRDEGARRLVGLVALRGRPAGGGRKPPRGAPVKSRGAELAEMARLERVRCGSRRRAKANH